MFPAMQPRYAASLFADDDGSISECGAFAEFSWFVRDHLAELTEDDLRRIAGLVNKCMAAPEGDLAAAGAAVCFLSNLSHEPAAAALAPHLTGNAAEFLRVVHDA
jgi:hypothetical protein